MTGSRIPFFFLSSETPQTRVPMDAVCENDGSSREQLAENICNKGEELLRCAGEPCWGELVRGSTACVEERALGFCLLGAL